MVYKGRAGLSFISHYICVNYKPYSGIIKAASVDIDLLFEEQLNLGRVFSFVYGDKENGDAYLLSKVSFNGKVLAQNLRQLRFSVYQRKFLCLHKQNFNLIEITLN